MTLLKENFLDKFVSSTCLTLCKLFPSRTRTIPCPDKPELPLLTQFVIIPEKLYLQHFHNPNEKDVYHDHRWLNMRSFVLSSNFIEERMDEKPSILHHKKFETYTMSACTRHRIETWGKHCWTLFYMGEVVNPDWGYWKEDEKNTEQHTPWYEYIADNVKIPHVETGEITRHPCKGEYDK